jgi:hypothetical protein
MIVANMMKCPDGTILQSKHRHDYVDYTDKNGVHYFLDGGLSYIRFSGNGELITYHHTDSIASIREHMYWGKNYDENGNVLEETEWVRIKDITDSHLDALIVYWEERLEKYKEAEIFVDIFKREKEYRNGKELHD